MVAAKDMAVAFKAFAKILDDMNKGGPQPELSDPDRARSLWQDVVEIADNHNQPGVFTTFPAFRAGAGNTHSALVDLRRKNIGHGTAG